MTSKEKAFKLCQKFGAVTMFSDDNEGYTLSLENAKKCALICVDEILKTEPNTLVKTTEKKDGVEVQFKWLIEYWDEVKQEIEKL